MSSEDDEFTPGDNIDEKDVSSSESSVGSDEDSGTSDFSDEESPVKKIKKRRKDVPVVPPRLSTRQKALLLVERISSDEQLDEEERNEEESSTKKRRVTLTDRKLTNEETKCFHKREKRPQTQLDTPMLENMNNPDACLICFNDDGSEENNYLVFCDGGCDLAFHQMCYGIEIIPDGDWYCRRCEWIREKGVTEKADDSIFPGEIKAETTDQSEFNKLYQNGDFAAICHFFFQFAVPGLHIPPVTIDELSRSIMNPDNSHLHVDLFVKLMQKINYWRLNVGEQLDEKWENCLSNVITKQNSGANPLLDHSYDDISVDERVMILKVLCDAQFDRNSAFKDYIKDLNHKDLRERPLGFDRQERQYWITEDATVFWISRCNAKTGENWELVCKTSEKLDELIQYFSLSCHSNELLLWRALSRDIKPYLDRKSNALEKRKRTLAGASKRLNATGLDLSAIIHDQDVSERRSRRARKEVDYTFQAFDESISNSLRRRGHFPPEGRTTRGARENTAEYNPQKYRSRGDRAQGRWVNNDEDEGEQSPSPPPPNPYQDSSTVTRKRNYVVDDSDEDSLVQADSPILSDHPSDEDDDCSADGFNENEETSTPPPPPLSPFEAPAREERPSSSYASSLPGT